MITMTKLPKRAIKIFAFFLLVGCYILLIDIHSSMKGIQAKTSKSLYVKNNLPTYDLSCPFAMGIYMGVGPDKEASLKFSQESGAQSVIVEALESNAATDRKVVIVGDSHMRQIFSSLACIARTTGFWKDDDSYTKAVYPPRDEYNDARLKLKEGYGEIFYAPTAGKTQQLRMAESRDPIHGNEDWLECCRERKPFYLDSYTYDAANVRDYFSENDDRFEKVLLGKKDVVFFNAGTRGHLRTLNTENLVALLECVATAKGEGEDPGWPQLSIFTSNHHHYQNVKTPAHFHTNAGSTQSCLEEVNTEMNPFLQGDKTFFGDHPHNAGFDLDLGRTGNMHLGKGNHNTDAYPSDCATWTMPGVPDVYAKELAVSILSLRPEN